MGTEGWKCRSLCGPHLNITTEVHQTAGALTLTSAYSILFKVSSEMLDDVLKSEEGCAAEFEYPSGANMLKSKKGAERRARLQHSLNVPMRLQPFRRLPKTQGVVAKGQP